MILQYNLEAQLIKRERALAGHYTIINMGLEGNSVVFPRVLIFHKMLIMGPEIHQEWGYQKSLPRAVTINRTRQVTFLHTQETNIMCILDNTVNFSEVSYDLPLFKLVSHIKVKNHSCKQQSLQNLIHQN